MQGVKRSQATLDAAQERTQLGEPMGPSLDPKHPMRFVPACELDAVSGALLEMEQDHESPEQVLACARPGDPTAPGMAMALPSALG